ncbi:MAG TPA: hypothetical protein VIG75_00200 [Citricoccus sp.]
MAGDSRNSDLLRPQSPEVYRRRRIVALVLLLVVVALVVGLVWWLVSLFRPAGEPAPSGADTASPSVTAPASPTGAPASPSDDASGGASGEATGDASPTASATETATEASSDNASPTAGEGTLAACQPGDLVISAATDQPTYADGEDPVLELRVDNTGDEPCEANLGTSQQVFTVYSGSDRIFSTQDCQVDGADAMMEISPEEQERSRFTWERVRSAPECAEVGSEPRSGTYRLEVSLGELSAQPVSFTLQ